MRTTARISLLTLPVLLTLPAGCDRATQPEFTVRPPEPQNSVAYLKSLCEREEQRRDSAGHHHPRIRHGQ